MFLKFIILRTSPLLNDVVNWNNVSERNNIGNQNSLYSLWFCSMSSICLNTNISTYCHSLYKMFLKFIILRISRILNDAVNWNNVFIKYIVSFPSHYEKNWKHIWARNWKFSIEISIGNIHHRSVKITH